MIHLNPIRTYGESMDYADLADFVEFCRVKGVSHFKNKDLEFSFEKQEDKKVLPTEGVNPTILEEMPADDVMLMASSDTVDFGEDK